MVGKRLFEVDCCRNRIFPGNQSEFFKVVFARPFNVAEIDYTFNYMTQISLTIFHRLFIKDFYTNFKTFDQF